MTHAPRRFPWWVPAGGLALALLYLPTLSTPFDFVDDGNLVYPSEPTDLGGHVGLWWEKVRANYDHLGPFRPTLWVHWQLQANLFGGDAATWRLYRLLWCALAATMLLWLFRELGARPAAALAAGALAMWNPYRNEVWTSLTLAEGVAMPYALLGLVAARKAASSPSPLKWELASAAGVLVALGCKNTFAALVPAQILLRLWPGGVSLREAVRQNGPRAALLGATLALPAAHFVYFKLHWHPGQYETHGPTLAQLGRILNSLKGAVSAEFLAVGVVLALVAVRAGRSNRGVGDQGLAPLATRRRPLRGLRSEPPEGAAARSQGRKPLDVAPLAAVVLLLGGVIVYLPMGMMSGRYAMPAVWGLDILFALLLTRLAAAPASGLKAAAWAGVVAGLAAVAVAGVGKAEKFAARAKMLWQVVHHLEATAEPNARVAWVSGPNLNVEEGIHVGWHLYHRGRGDIRIGLVDGDGRPVERVELPPAAGLPDILVGGDPSDGSGYWCGLEDRFDIRYWFGTKHRFTCYAGRCHWPAGWPGR